MKCLIVSGGTPPAKNELKRSCETADITISVDGAADLFYEYDIVPGVLIGDFDTAKPECVKSLEQRGAKVIKLMPEKNVTDTEAAIDYAIDSKADEILLLGAIGTRADHSLSNIMLMIKAYKAGIKCKIKDEYNEMIVSDKDFVFAGKAGQTISILPLTGELCVSATNVKYPLDNLMLRFGSSRGISNIMQKDECELSISGGFALIVKSQDKA